MVLAGVGLAVSDSPPATLVSVRRNLWYLGVEILGVEFLLVRFVHKNALTAQKRTKTLFCADLRCFCAVSAF